MTWTGGFASPEPPQGVDHVRDGVTGNVMDRLERECDYCGPGHNVWRWRHNGNSDCWLDMDGYAPWTEVGPASLEIEPRDLTFARNRETGKVWIVDDTRTRWRNES